MNVATRYAAIVLLLSSGAAGCGDLEDDETADEVKVLDPAGEETITSALSGVHDGKSPSAVSGCSSNFHIGDYSRNRIKASNRYGTRDYGWWEWRYSNTSSCSGYQWVRLHIENQMPFAGTYLSTRYWRMDAPSTFIFNAITPSVVNATIVGGLWSTTASVLNPGTYNGKILYSRGVKSCADLASDLAVVGNWDFWAWAAFTAKICA